MINYRRKAGHVKTIYMAALYKQLNQKLKKHIGSTFSDTSCKSDFVDSLYFMTESYEKTDVIRSLHFLLFTICV